jgi:hypothetical protein
MLRNEASGWLKNEIKTRLGNGRRILQSNPSPPRRMKDDKHPFFIIASRLQKGMPLLCHFDHREKSAEGKIH